ARAPVFLGDRTPGSRTHRGIAFCRPLRGLRFFLGIVPPIRGLTGGYILSPAARAPVFLGDRTPGSRTHRGLHSVARSAGSGFSSGSYPRFAASPGASVLSPATRAPVFLGDRTPGSRTHRGLRSVARCAGSGFSWGSCPRFADSPGDSVLSPATRAPVFLGDRTPGSRTHRGLHSVARCAGSGFSWGLYPRFADSPGATFCRPLRGLRSFLGTVPRFADSRGATFCRPLRGLRSFLGIVPPVRGLTGG